ncbi:N-6 DNA methylase [Candidatus Poriferisodalis multihospitum]|uniref:N-6 DNA methylase n=1 Tax=Candidatus Poriferisodalis multihospitum TaxID=2983191 RepID=UPI002B25B200|nr:N-6 DNA methylase [Candidatus Poriferisodalis multihospitum]
MNTELSADDPRFVKLAGELLHWHGTGAHEDNIRSAVRNFLVETELTDSYDVQSEASPDPQRIARRRVDLALSDAFIEVKRLIGTAADAATPAAEHVAQLDGYLKSSPDVNIGVLTDGRHWLRRTTGQLDIPTAYPWAFTLEKPNDGVKLFRWLNEYIFSGRHAKAVHVDTIGTEFGPASPVYVTQIEQIRKLFEQHGQERTVAIKYDLWQELLAVALGEIVGSGPEETLHSLFVRHTYLVTMIGMITQSTYGIDIERLCSNDPADLLIGRKFASDTGIEGVIESDFFTWLTEVDGGLDVIREMAAWVASYDWPSAQLGLASALYQSVIPAVEREQLGEYYTPGWLATAIVESVVTDPLQQRVLDPACGSGSFLVAAIENLLSTAREAEVRPEAVLDKLRHNVVGIDVHPVAVHLARSEWVLAARDAIAGSQSRLAFAPPVYLGDSLQMITQSDGMLGQLEVAVPVTGDPRRRELRFPRSLIERPETFDAAMEAVAAQIRSGGDPEQALVDAGVEEVERLQLASALGVLAELHSEGRDHIWSYYARNVVRPLIIAAESVDVVVGNPPWITYNQTVARLGARLRQLSVDYGIWEGAQYATNADLAALFFTRCADLYLASGGVCAMVMPHSALAQGQYTRWRTGRWLVPGAELNMNMACSIPWDLETLEPNNFFPVPACVVFGRREEVSQGLPNHVEQWTGEPDSLDVERSTRRLVRTSKFQSPYSEFARNGATIYPRCLFFVDENPLTGPVAASDSIRVDPRRGPNDKKPWRSLNLDSLAQRTVERTHLFKVALGESIAPFLMLTPQLALLPIADDWTLTRREDDRNRVDLTSLCPRMREWWVEVSAMWEARRNTTLANQLDHMGKLSVQLDSDSLSTGAGLRVLYPKSGWPVAAICEDESVIVENSLYWITVRSRLEAEFLCGVINAEQIRSMVAPHMSKGLYGPRDLHSQLWKLPIPEFDETSAVHLEVVHASRNAAQGAKRVVDEECARRGTTNLNTQVVRRSVRKWLRNSEEGVTAEEAIARVLDKG